MTLDDFKPSIIYVAATPEQVWQALTTAQFSRKYFHGLSAELEPRAGGTFVLSSLKSLLETGDALVIKMEPPRGCWRR
jgi:uncharacterized protein YndB with AHSA1/START domain